MYIDYLKNDYSNKKEQEREEYIARDKKHLAGLIQERITNDIEHIVDRWYELDDIGIVAACQASVGGNHHHRLLFGGSRLQIPVLHMPYSFQNAVHRIVHTVKVSPGVLCIGPGALQLYGGHQLHGLGNLLRTLNTAFTALDITH